MFKNKVHHVVINQLALKLESVHQAFLTDSVNHAGNPGRFLGDDIQGFHGENLCRPFGVLKMRTDVSLGFSAVQVRDHAVHINALPYGGITLETELLGPQFRLSHKNQRHGTRGIEFKVQQEPKFFQSFLVKQMSLVQDTDDFLLVVCPNPPDFILQLVFASLR